jgi:hypothetical protein
MIGRLLLIAIAGVAAGALVPAHGAPARSDGPGRYTLLCSRHGTQVMHEPFVE